MDFIINVIKEYFSFSKKSYSKNLGDVDIKNMFDISELVEVVIRPENYPENIEIFGNRIGLHKLVISACIEILFRGNVGNLYTHQAEFVSKVLEEKKLLGHAISVPTATGKTEAFLIPVLNEAVNRIEMGIVETTAIFIYPLKSLEADQLNRFVKYAIYLKENNVDVTIGIWNGDTPNSFSTKDIGTSPRGIKCPKCDSNLEINANKTMQCVLHPKLNFTNILLTRSAIRKRPPTILITNPEALEYRILSLSENFQIPESVAYIIFDEAHVWKGVSIKPMKTLISRLKKMCNAKFLLASATLGKDFDDLQSFLAKLLSSTDFQITKYTSTRLPPEIMSRLKGILDLGYPFLIPLELAEQASGMTIKNLNKKLLDANLGLIKSHMSLQLFLPNQYCIDCKIFLGDAFEEHALHQIGSVLECQTCTRLYVQSAFSRYPIFDDCTNHYTYAQPKIDSNEFELFASLMLAGLFNKRKDKVLLYTNSRYQAEVLANKFFENFIIYYIGKWLIENLNSTKANYATEKEKILTKLKEEFIHIPYGESRDGALISGYWTIFNKLLNINSTHFSRIVVLADIYFGGEYSYEYETSFAEDTFRHMLLVEIFRYSRFNKETNLLMYKINDKKLFNRMKRVNPGFVSRYNLKRADVERMVDNIISIGILSYESKNEYSIKENNIWLFQGNIDLFCPHCNESRNIKLGDYCINCDSELTLTNQLDFLTRLSVSPLRVAVHKGGIKAETRNAIEKTLKTEQPKINIVTSTSTLEMGIDIGDLSKLIQVDYPVEFSRYVQRVGRIGRRDIERNIVLNIVPNNSMSGFYTHEKFKNGEYYWEEHDSNEKYSNQYLYGQIIAMVFTELKLRDKKRYEEIRKVSGNLNPNVPKLEFTEACVKYTNHLINLIRATYSLIKVDLEEIIEKSVLDQFETDSFKGELKQQFIDKLIGIYEILHASFLSLNLEEKAVEKMISRDWSELSLLMLLSSLGWFCNYRSISQQAVLSRVQLVDDEYQIRLYQSKSAIKGVVENSIHSSDYYAGASYETLEVLCGKKKIANYSICLNDDCILFMVPNDDIFSKCEFCESLMPEIIVHNYIGSIMKTMGFSYPTRSEVIDL